jgi:hypothetical protein
MWAPSGLAHAAEGVMSVARAWPSGLRPTLSGLAPAG